jgi:hypothetical protein
MLKPRNLFFLLAALTGVLAFIFGLLISPSPDIPELKHLANAFVGITIVMSVTGAIYLLMDKLNRPIHKKIAAGHYKLFMLSVGVFLFGLIKAFITKKPNTALG